MVGWSRFTRIVTLVCLAFSLYTLFRAFKLYVQLWIFLHMFKLYSFACFLADFLSLSCITASVFQVISLNTYSSNMVKEEVLQLVFWKGITCKFVVCPGNYKFFFFGYVWAISSITVTKFIPALGHLDCIFVWIFTSRESTFHSNY